ncbi:thioredoxin [Kitasatospora sp. CB02891]|uniref:thioredoxin n=1 Tax=Kitasatospora sp. CB02891 TaxID=2020329 RepID=UPI000C27EA73|nr:thioredoxin [Kitasatospora sp. CB02891]PJN29145.1 thioredoxin [Kitasatospora sp. CB02891]
MTAEQTGQRVQEALDRLAEYGAQETGEHLVRELMEMYGDGLTRLVRAVPPPALDRLLDDPVVAGLLVLHDLHPEDATARIRRALATLAEPVELSGYEPATGTARLRRTRGGCGCSEQDIETVLACHAPEVTALELEQTPQLLQISARPPSPAEAR